MLLFLEPLKLDGLQYLGRRTSIEKIVVECCQLGSEKCQYLWIYGDDCYAVSCTTTPQACEPTHQQRDQATTTSIYVKIEHNSNILKEWNTRNDISNEADKHPTRPNPTRPNPPPATPLTPSPAIPPNAPPATPPNAPPATPPNAPPATPSNAPPPSSDVPPVADAGPDRTIRLPENSVTLLGDKSYDDKVSLIHCMY